MSIKLYPEFFNDVFGPISNPGSSSHMSGPCRAGYVANSLLGEDVKKIEIYLDKNGSFSAAGFGQMNEDTGMLNGAYGHLPDAEGFFEIRNTLDKEGISYEFIHTDLMGSKHPNAMKFVLTGKSGEKISLIADSTGGGMIGTVSVNGFKFFSRADAWTVLLFFNTGTGEDEYKKAEEYINACYGILSGGESTEISKGETSEYSVLKWFFVLNRPDKEEIRKIFSAGEVRTMAPVLPVTTTDKKKPQKYSSVREWRETAKAEGKSMYEAAVEYEEDASGWSRQEVIDYMENVVGKALYRRINALYENPDLLMVNPFRTIYHREWEEITADSHLVSGITKRAIRYMHSAQAQMRNVLDVPGPMSNGAGYLFSVLMAVKEEYGLKEEALYRGLFVAASFGAIAYTRSEPTGEIIGCAGECGVCAAMTAAAIVEMLNGTDEQIENAASFTLQAAIGWPCDPIPGGQGTPCTARTLFIVSMPQVYAQWAMMGAACTVPFDEVLQTADEVGRSMSGDLLCTCRGGLCATASGRRCAENFFKNRK